MGRYLADSGSGGSAIVQHPNNPSISRILECTAHLRPTEGIPGSPGTPQGPPLPPGPAPATPATTTIDEKKRFKQDLLNIIKTKHPPIEVQLPNYPMIASFFQKAGYLRWIHDTRHFQKPVIAPSDMPEYTPPPRGSFPARSAAQIPIKQQEAEKQRLVANALKHTPMGRKMLVDDPLKLLKQKEAILRSELKAGPSRPQKEVMNDIQEVCKRIESIVREAELDDAGGKIAEGLARRLKKMAEEDGVPPNDIP